MKVDVQRDENPYIALIDGETKYMANSQQH